MSLNIEKLLIAKYKPNFRKNHFNLNQIWDKSIQNSGKISNNRIREKKLQNQILLRRKMQSDKRIKLTIFRMQKIKLKWRD